MFQFLKIKLLQIFSAALFWILLSITNYSLADVWRFQACGFDGCAFLRTADPGEWCQVNADGVWSSWFYGDMTTTERYGAFLYAIVVGIRNPEVPGSLGQVRCVHEQGQFTFQAMTDPTPCPLGKGWDSTAMGCFERRDNNKCTAGNPVQIASGKKVDEFIDIKSPRGDFFSVSRLYDGHNLFEIAASDNQFYKGYTQFKYTDTLQITHYIGIDAVHFFVVILQQPNGQSIIFYSTDGTTYQNRNGDQEKLIHTVASGIDSWTITFEDYSSKTFDSEGKLVNVFSPQYGSLDFTYSAGFKKAVSTSKYFQIKYNNQIIYTYNYNKKDIANIVDANGKVYSYTYDSYDNITRVTFPDGKIAQYLYEDTTFKKALTGIIDEKNVRAKTWVYDASGRAISSEHANGTDKTLFSYNADGSTAVTNALGKQTIYRFTDVSGSRRLTSVEGQPSTNCAAANKLYTYTSDGRVSTSTDWNGNVTSFQYNQQGQEISRTEGVNTPQSRTITTAWDPILNLKTQVNEPNKVTSYTYDSVGRLLSTTVHSLQ